MTNTLGEIIFATVLSGVVAVLAGIAAFVGMTLLCAKMLSGEATQAALVLAPAAAFVSAVFVFLMSFRKIIRYGT
jgi:hypothetical protein